MHWQRTPPRFIASLSVCSAVRFNASLPTLDLCCMGNNKKMQELFWEWRQAQQGGTLGCSFGQPAMSILSSNPSCRWKVTWGRAASFQQLLGWSWDCPKPFPGEHSMKGAVLPEHEPHMDLNLQTELLWSEESELLMSWRTERSTDRQASSAQWHGDGLALF